jgi:hypothetical protein
MFKQRNERTRHKLSPAAVTGRQWSLRRPCRYRVLFPWDSPLPDAAADLIKLAGAPRSCAAMDR